jgi:hypothetical protein
MNGARRLNEEVYVKSTIHNREVLVAACDADLLGKTLEGGRVPFKVSESFYKGELMEVETSLDFIKRGTIVNLVGRKIVEAAIEARLVHPEAVLYIGQIPHAQIVKM